MNAKVDEYIKMSTRWSKELVALRSILLGCGLTEELKWGKPCYVRAGANIVILQEMKAFLSLMFFKGALLTDPEKILVEQGPNSRSARRLQFTSLADVDALRKAIVTYVDEAVRVEAEGVRLEPRPNLMLADELQQYLADNPLIATAFSALTPGRQREYNLHIIAAKRSDTRISRIEKVSGKIRAGKGLRD